MRFSTRAWMNRTLVVTCAPAVPFARCLVTSAAVMATILVLLVTTCPAHAQTRSGLGDLSKEIQQGQTLMLERVDGRRITGELREINADGVLLLVDGTVMSIAAAEIRELGVTSDSLTNGALIGLAIGAGVGMMAAATSGSSGERLVDAATAGPAALLGMAAGAGAGVGIGIGLDALVRRYRILYQAPVRVTAITTVGGGYGLAFRLSW